MPDDKTRNMKRATYADIEALPDHVVGELIDGRLYVTRQRGGRRHRR